MVQMNQQTLSPSAAAGGPATAIPRVRILVVDDDDEFRESLSLNLMDEGFAVTTFANGPAVVVDFDAPERADVIPLYWRLPRVKQLGGLRAVRQRGVLHPALFMTPLNDDLYEG